MRSSTLPLPASSRHQEFSTLQQSKFASFRSRSPDETKLDGLQQIDWKSAPEIVASMESLDLNYDSATYEKLQGQLQVKMPDEFLILKFSLISRFFEEKFKDV